MKLKSEYVTYPVDGKEIMVGTGSTSFKGMIKMNVTAAYIVSCLKEETDRDDVIEKMMKKYDAEREVIAADVDKLIETLRGIGALDE